MKNNVHKIDVIMEEHLPSFETLKEVKKHQSNAKKALKALGLPCKDINNCRLNRRCYNGFCPVCTRLIRKKILSASTEISQLKYHFVTINPKGWLIPANDNRQFDSIIDNKQIKAFIEELKKDYPENLIVIGGIEVLYKTIGNVPQGKRFHMHCIISGPTKNEIKKAASRNFKLDDRMKNPLLIKEVKATEEDFFKTISYAFKQPLLAKSFKHKDSKGVYQTLQTTALEELIQNYGPHSVFDRLILEGVKWDGSKFIITAKIKNDQR